MSRIGMSKMGVKPFGGQGATFANSIEIDATHEPISFDVIGVFNPSVEDFDGWIVTEEL